MELDTRFPAGSSGSAAVQATVHVRQGLGAATTGSLTGADGLRQRLRLLAGLCAGAFAVVALLGLGLPSPEGAGRQIGWLGVKIAVAGTLMWWLMRRPFSHLKVVTLVVGFIITVALALALVEVRLVPKVVDERMGISGIGLWLILALVLVPLPPLAAALAAVGGTVMLPLLWLGSLILGERLCPGYALTMWCLPVAFCAGLGWFAGWRLHRSDVALQQAKRELRELGRYDLIRRLGGGGMGEVWLARHRLLPRQAAIKLIRPPADSDQLKIEAAESAFRAEAGAVGRLTSAHTVTLFDYGVSDAGQWFQVMELLEGIDLQRLVTDHGPLADWRVARILAQICRSLAEAHQFGLVHRDIKPGNIMVCRLGDEIEFAKVLDFGLVQPRGVILPEEEGCWVGTPGYIAPELINGRAPDGRADLYALGAVGWWLLTGERVLPATGFVEELERHRDELAPPLLSVAPDTDPALAVLIDQLLAKEPLARPANASAVRRRLIDCPCWSRIDEAGIARFWAKHLPSQGD
jgi:hypothetical protein